MRVMVVLWLLSGLIARRCRDQTPQPFSHKKIRRVIPQQVHSDKISQVLEDLGAQLVGGNTPYIYGALDVTPGFAYNHAARLSELEREQYLYWISMGVPTSELWCFKITHTAVLQDPVPAAQYMVKRFSRVYSVVGQDTAQETCALVQDAPEWLCAELASAELDDSHVAVILPEPFAVLCKAGLFDYWILPSPKSRVVACS